MKKVLSKCAELVASSNVARLRAVDSDDIACTKSTPHVQNDCTCPRSLAAANPYKQDDQVDEDSPDATRRKTVACTANSV